MKVKVACPECNKSSVRDYEDLVRPDNRHHELALSKISRVLTNCSECREQFVVTMELSVRTSTSKVYASAN